MTTLEQYAKAAIERHEVNHREADSLLYNSAGFHWDARLNRYLVTVRDLVVLEAPKLREAERFIIAHNDRLFESTQEGT